MNSGLMLMARCIVVGALLVSLATTPVTAVTSGGKSEQALPGEDDYGRGKAAFDREDWEA